MAILYHKELQKSIFTAVRTYRSRSPALIHHFCNIQIAVPAFTAKKRQVYILFPVQLSYYYIET